MAAEKVPAFQFYPKEFLTDGNVAGMSLQERGAYITLICLCWQEKTLPMDVGRLANMVGLPLPAFKKIWPAVSECFREQDGRLIHPRLEKEREKQAKHREAQSEKGKASAASRANRDSTGGQPDCNRGSTAVQPDGQPEANSPISDLRSPVSVLRKSSTETRSKRPIFTGQRLTVFEWQLDRIAQMLGVHLDGFDVHAFFFDLDARAARDTQVMPARDGGEWLFAQVLAEAKRRGLPIAQAPIEPKQKVSNLTARMGAMVANARREAQS